MHATITLKQSEDCENKETGAKVIAKKIKSKRRSKRKRKRRVRVKARKSPKMQKKSKSKAKSVAKNGGGGEPYHVWFRRITARMRRAGARRWGEQG